MTADSCVTCLASVRWSTADAADPALPWKKRAEQLVSLLITLVMVRSAEIRKRKERMKGAEGIQDGS
jgi:hypothetical protein